jgi:hypothetical protein
MKPVTRTALATLVRTIVIPGKFFVILREGGGPRRGIQSLVLASLLTPGALAKTDPQSGLLVAEGFDQVKAQCTACHSGRLVAQNRADRDGWLQMIRWMQETQGLWPLGEAEPVILDYLAEHYGPLPRGRRAPLNVTFD